MGVWFLQGSLIPKHQAGLGLLGSINWPNLSPFVRFSFWVYVTVSTLWTRGVIPFAVPFTGMFSISVNKKSCLPSSHQTR